MVRYTWIKLIIFNRKYVLTFIEFHPHLLVNIIRDVVSSYQTFICRPVPTHSIKYHLYIKYMILIANHFYISIAFIKLAEKNSYTQSGITDSSLINIVWFVLCIAGCDYLVQSMYANKAQVSIALFALKWFKNTRIRVFKDIM